MGSIIFERLIAADSLIFYSLVQTSDSKVVGLWLVGNNLDKSATVVAGSFKQQGGSFIELL